MTKLKNKNQASKAERNRWILRRDLKPDSLCVPVFDVQSGLEFWS